MAAKIIVFAHSSLDDGANFVNCASNNNGYGDPVVFPGEASFLITVVDAPPGVKVGLRIDWYSPEGQLPPVLSAGGPAYVPGTGRYPATGSDPLTWKVTFQPGRSGYVFPTVTFDDTDNYDAYGNINWLMGNGGGTAWGSTEDRPAVDPGPPLGDTGGGDDGGGGLEPIPIIPGAKEIGWWVAPGNNNALVSFAGAFYGLTVKTSGVGDEFNSYENIYAGVVNPDRRTVIWISEWTPATDAPAPNLTYPIALGELQTPDGVQVQNPPNDFARRHGVLKLRASIDGVLSKNRLILTMAPGGLYGTTAYSTEDVNVEPTQFWCDFTNTFEIV